MNYCFVVCYFFHIVLPFICLLFPLHLNLCCQEFDLCSAYTNYAFPVSDPHINPFIPNARFFYSLKTSENRKVLWCFQGVEKGCIGNEWVKQVQAN